MKNTCGMIGFMVVALITFRLLNGAWPPMEGRLGEWLASNPRAVWAMIAGVVGPRLCQELGRSA